MSFPSGVRGKQELGIPNVCKLYMHSTRVPIIREKAKHESE
jgi:hypothetical protein